MKIGIQVALILVLVFVFIGLLRYCEPFTYLEDNEKPILKGGVQQ